MASKKLALGATIAVILCTTGMDKATGQSGGAMAVFGAGSSSCAAWSRNLFHVDDRREQVSWVYGYISGRSETPKRQQSLSHSSGSVISGWIDRYCASNPNEMLVGVAERMLGEIDKGTF